jgi:hypothetical protein
MPMLDEFIVAARMLGLDGFLKENRHSFLLLHEAPADESHAWTFKTQTVSSGRALLATMLNRENLKLSPEALRYQVFPLVKGKNNPWPHISVGRARNNDVVLLDPSVSKLHAHIERDAEGYLLRDAGSRNGTSVNELALQPQQTVRLQSGAKLVIGNVELMFLDPREFHAFVMRHVSEQAKA